MVALIPDGRLNRTHFTSHSGSGVSERTAMERIYLRVDHDFGFERHFMRSRALLQARTALAVAVMLEMALCHALAGWPGQMRSVAGAIPISGSHRSTFTGPSDPAGHVPPDR